MIFDNASIYTAKKLKPYWDLLEEQGMQFYFLPTHSPELNRIELLWHKMKYEWLRFKLYTPDELEQAIDEIGQGFCFIIHVKRGKCQSRFWDQFVRDVANYNTHIDYFHWNSVNLVFETSQFYIGIG